MDTKICSKCKEDRPITEFYKRYSGRKDLGAYCKSCINKILYARDLYKKIKAIELCGGACQICKYDACLGALEFHHLDKNNKEVSFGDMRGWAWERMVIELKKCILLCCRCHREIHAKEDHWFDYKTTELLDINMHIDNDCADFINVYNNTTSKEYKKQKYLLDEKVKNITNNIVSTDVCFLDSCENEVYGTKYCSTRCLNIARRKVRNRPSKKQLTIEVGTMTWVAIGKKYGVTDNAVRKWAKSYGII